MPFDVISEKDSMFLGDGVSVDELLLFVGKYKGAQATVKDDHLCIDYKRNETPEEKSIRVQKTKKKAATNKANYLKSKEVNKNKPVADKLAAVKKFINPTSGDR